MVQRSKPWVLGLALVIGIAIPLYLNEDFADIAASCREERKAVCWMRDNTSEITGFCAALCIVLIIGYACTLKTTIIVGSASTGSCCGCFGLGEIYVHLLGRDATEHAELIIRKVHHARSEFLKKGQ